MDEKIVNEDIVIKLDAAQVHAVRNACHHRIAEIASNLSSEVTDFIEIEEMGTLADALFIICAALV